MLRRLRLNNWKSFADAAELPVARTTLLVGPNASGKSNVLDALRFLQGAALDLPLAEVLRGRWEGQREIWAGIRGHTAEATRHGCAEFTIETAWSPSNALFDGATLGDRHVVRVSTADDVLVEEERLTHNDYWYDTHSPTQRTNQGRTGDGLRTAVRATGKGGSPVVTYSAARLVLGQLQSGPRISEEAVEHARALREEVRELIFLDVQPGRMRDYRAVTAGQLGVNAENISPVLYRLKQENPAGLADVVDWLSELCGPTIEAIDFDRTRLGETMMFLVERGGAKVSARSASDGTLRFLGLVAALLTVPKGSTLLMEEPDVGLHPSRLHLLASLFEDTARARNLQVIATTHSPTLLAHLSPAALGDVLAFGRDPATGCSVAKRVGDLPHFATLRDAKDLEHLISNGWLERAL